MAVFALISVMLAFPLLSALGYIEKASARQMAQVSANKAVQQVANELSTAMYVFDVPPDGSWVAFLCENSASSAQNLGLPMDIAGSAVSYVRYARMLDFPWTSSASNWTLIKPDYLANTATDINIYSHYWQPFYANTGTSPALPYIVTRFAPAVTDSRSSWTNIWQPSSNNALMPAPNPTPYFPSLPAGLDGTYPMSSYTETNYQMLWRQYQNDMGAVTPVGQEWDVPRFQATPLRLISESLVLQADAGGFILPTSAVARYPFWCGRSLDLDNLSDSQLAILYPAQSLSSLDSLLQLWTPLYPTRRMNSAWQPGSPPGAVNPFGYQVQVFDINGNRVYGSNYNSTGVNAGLYTMINTRHFMDWPPFDRPDWDWTTSNSYLWSQTDISRQRLEGKLVFAQPVVPSASVAPHLQLQLPGSYQTSFSGTPAVFSVQNNQLQLPSDYQAGRPVILPIPQVYWNTQCTRLVTPPRQLTFTTTDGSSNIINVIFHLVKKLPSQLGAGEFCASTTTNLNPNGTYPVYCEITFGALPLTTSGQQVTWGNNTWGIAIANAPQAIYTITDLQPDDVVVATYSTKAVIDLELTLSRQDRAGRLAYSRQDFVVNRRITAENALKHARNNH